MKQYLFLIAIILFLASIAGIQQRRIRNLGAENRVLNENVSALLDRQLGYRVRDSLHAARIGMLTLTVDEYKRWREEDAILIGELRIRLKRVENIAKTATESRYSIGSIVRDTIIHYREREDTVRNFSYASSYIDLEGILKADSVAIQLQSYDTLLQVIHRVPRKFWFIRYGTQAIRQEIVSMNPHTRITYSELIRLKR